jgi:hypothetical protein
MGCWAMRKNSDSVVYEVGAKYLHITSMNYALKGCPVFVILVIVVRAGMCNYSGWRTALPALVTLICLTHIFMDFKLQMLRSRLLFVR